MGLDEWWSKGNGVSGKLVQAVLEQAQSVTFYNTDGVKCTTITPGTLILLVMISIN